MHWMWTFSEEKHFPHSCPIKTAVAGKNCESPWHGSWITTQHPDSRSDYGVAGVFGAGKTRAAAATIVGLLVIDPDLKLMVSTKENAAAQAFADHVLSFDLPEKINEKFGRLVGYLETKEGPSNQTRLNIHSQNLRQKAVLIGCGGGFRQEASQKVLAGGGMASTCGPFACAMKPSCLETWMMCQRSVMGWTGDHRQTSKGLKKTDPRAQERY